MIFLPCKLAFCRHYKCLLFAQSGSQQSSFAMIYIHNAQPSHHFSQAHSQLHCHCAVLQNLESKPQWEFKSGWYLARCGSTIVLEMSRRPEPIIPPLLRQMDLKLTASCADFKLELKIFCSYLFMKFCGCEARTFDQSVTIDQSLGGCYAK